MNINADNETGEVSKQMPEVLIVDDDPAVTAALVAAVQAHNLQTDTAANGQQALQKLCERTVTDNLYDAMILDIQMPIVDGWEVLHALKSNPLWKTINVVVLTGIADTPQDIARITDYDGVFVRKKEGIFEIVSDLVERIIPGEAQ